MALLPFYYFRGLVFLIVFEFTLCKPEVKLLHVLFRHGDKVPHVEYQNYPNDPHKNHSFYPIGNGGLTNDGKVRLYKLGTNLRTRYNESLGAYYTPDEVYARSTEVPRTQASLQLVLTAIYPPVGVQIWNPVLNWQPFYMEYKKTDEDSLLFPQSCDVYKDEYKRFLEQPETGRIVNKYSDTFKYLTEQSGKPIESTNDVYYLYNLFKEEMLQNLTLPSWTTTVYPSPMKEITALDFNLRSYTANLKRLNGGKMVRKITDDIKDLRSGILKPSTRKAFFFGAHELNVVGLARSLGLKDPDLPSYGSAVIVETLQDHEAEDAYFVRVLLYFGEQDEFVVQKIYDCSEICPLDDFVSLVKDVIPNDAEYHCYSEELAVKSPYRAIQNGGSIISHKNVLLVVVTKIVLILGFNL